MKEFDITEKKMEIIKKQSELINHLLQAYNAMISLTNKVQEHKDINKYFLEFKSVIDYSNIKITNAKVDVNNLINSAIKSIN